MIAGLVALALAAPSSFVALDEVDGTILQDMRYATTYNFVGRRIDGYREPVCLLTRDAARALRRAQAAVTEQGYTLKVYDCYRPQRAVDHFVRWSQNASRKLKREFYPRERKSRLFDRGYIARRSGHSRGSTVDLTLVKLPAREQPVWCTPRERRRHPDTSVNMGTGYDCLDSRSHTRDPRISARARRNRLLLERTMIEAGFEPYAKEWWHFTLADERYPGTYFDFPVSRSSLR
jgi:zinc D-Ala-D-Ala dipeptidase